MKKLSREDKYRLYEESVQNYEGDIEFINEEYHRIYNRNPLLLREDFCGTAAMACNWVKQSPHHYSWGIDKDTEPIGYGKDYHFANLRDRQKKRMSFINGNVLDEYSFKADIITAFNFSYQVFKKRRHMLEYFKKVREGLGEEGLFLIDIFGGTETFQSLEEETEFDHHSYFWDCDKYNPISHEVLYYIHFKLKGTKYKKVFTYDWRMWTIMELRELLIDAGFRKTYVYWEGEDEDGEGNGIFYTSEEEENCESWVTYIGGIP